jgi:hypothetical protein
MYRLNQANKFTHYVIYPNINFLDHYTMLKGKNIIKNIIYIRFIVVKDY